MRIRSFIAVILCLIFATATALFQRRPTPALQLLLFPIFILFLGSLIFGVVSIFRLHSTPGEMRIWRIIPLVACLLAILSFINLGTYLNKLAFTNYLPSMNALVAQFDSIPVGQHRAVRDAEIPKELKKMIYRIHARRPDTSHIEVAFFYGGGFPVKHSAWYFSSNDSPPERREWPRQARLQKNWFKAGD